MKNIILYVGLIIIGIGIGIVFFRFVPNFKGFSSFANTLPLKTSDPVEAKKQSLAIFYNKLSTALDTQDWVALYDLAPQSLKDNVTLSQFTTFESNSNGKSKTYSQKTVVNTITVDGDNGTVNRTVVTCVTKECTGSNKSEATANKQYIYVGGSWQIKDPQPSQKSLDASAYLYTNSSQTDQQTFLNSWGYGSSNPGYATKNFAIYLDDNTDKLALLEAWIDKNKADRSRPVVNNYQQPSVIQQPVYIPPPMQTYPTSCYTNTIGSYSYTNCY